MSVKFLPYQLHRCHCNLQPYICNFFSPSSLKCFNSLIMVALAWMTHLCPFKNLLQVTVITQKKVNIWGFDLRASGIASIKIAPKEVEHLRNMLRMFLSLMLRRQASRKRKKCAVEFSELRLPKNEKKMWKSRRRHKKRIEKKCWGKKNCWSSF